jgi:FkbM family methyltransferase
MSLSLDIREAVDVASGGTVPQGAVELLACRHGTMLALRADDVIGRSLRLYGEWSEHELSRLRPFIRAGTTVIDVGANIGTHTLAFSKWATGGGVIAVEPQMTAMCLLYANCLLNGLTNVETVNAACANVRGEAFVDTFDASNPGATGFKRNSGLRWQLRRLLSPRANATAVPLVRIDDLAKDRLVSLIKIDAEGMEYEVLAGAKALLRESRPAVFCEQNDTSQLAAIHHLLTRFNYQLYWLETHQFNKANFRGARDNIWWRTETGILAVHSSASPPRDLAVVDKDAAEIPSRCDAREGLLVI